MNFLIQQIKTIPVWQWGILGMFLILVPYGIYTIANDLSGGNVFIVQDDPEREHFRQGVYNNTIMMAIMLEVALTVIFIFCPRGFYEEPQELYNSKGVKLR